MSKSIATKMKLVFENCVYIILLINKYNVFDEIVILFEEILIIIGYSITYVDLVKIWYFVYYCGIRYIYLNTFFNDEFF